jgi:hypothetical protein
MSIDHLPSPHRVRKKYRIDRRAGAIVAVGPKVGVGIERLARRRVTEPRLHRLDTLAMPDQQAGIEMPQLMKARWLRRPSEHDHIVSSPPSTDVVDSSYRWRPLRHGRGAEADPTAAPGAAAVSDSGELAGSRRFSSRNPWGVEQPIDHLALPRPQLQPFPARCLRCGDEPFDGRGDTSPAGLRQPRQIQAQR